MDFFKGYEGTCSCTAAYGYARRTGIGRGKKANIKYKILTMLFLHSPPSLALAAVPTATESAALFCRRSFRISCHDHHQTSVTPRSCEQPQPSFSPAGQCLYRETRLRIARESGGGRGRTGGGLETCTRGYKCEAERDTGWRWANARVQPNLGDRRSRLLVFQVKLLIKPPKCWLVSASVFPGCRSTRRIHVDSMFDKSGTSRLVAKLCISQE